MGYESLSWQINLYEISQHTKQEIIITIIIIIIIIIITTTTTTTIIYIYFFEPVSKLGAKFDESNIFGWQISL